MDSQPTPEPNGDLAQEAWRSIFTSEAAGRYLFHYTRLSTAVESILPSRQLRFSRFSRMRDPRESHWAFGAGFFGEIPDADRLYWEVVAALEETKSSVRILSLTADLPGDAGSQLHGRGFAHPRLWEQYAGNHVGVCLCLDKDALKNAVDDVIERIGGILHEGRVNYRDGEIAIAASHFDLQAAYERGAVRFVLEHLDEHLHELFFTKLTDWESEVEYRFLTRWEASEELFVDVSQALRAVVIGHAVAREYAPTVRALCDPFGIAAARLQWTNGRPIVFKFIPRREGDLA